MAKAVCPDSGIAVGFALRRPDFCAHERAWQFESTPDAGGSLPYRVGKARLGPTPRSRLIWNRLSGSDLRRDDSSAALPDRTLGSCRIQILGY